MSHSRDANWFKIYKSQYLMSRNSAAETLLLGDSITKDLMQMKKFGTSIFLATSISTSGEIALKMLFGELSTCQKCLI